MLVSRQNYENIIDLLGRETVLAIDTETTGVALYGGEDRLFSIAIASKLETFYFNYHPYQDALDSHLESFGPMRKLTSDPQKIWFLHNAKFDMGFLEKENLPLIGKVYCTWTGSRILYNEHMTYSLSECAKRIGLEKSDAVEEFISKHKLYEWHKIPGKQKRDKKKFFLKVPLPIISDYAEKDARVTYELGFHVLNSISSPEQEVLENEATFTRTAYNIEKTGIKIDRPYVERAQEFERMRCHDATLKFKDLTSLEFSDGRKVLGNVFGGVLDRLPKTIKGSPSFDDTALRTISPTFEKEKKIAETILEHREHFKKLNSYYLNFLHFADSNDILHPNIRQAGTATGRISIVDPALQTVNKEEDKTQEYSVRKSFIPREGYLFLEMDYKAMEFRMLLDYAGEERLARQIEKGLDPHQATANLVKIDRRSAKTISFGLLYGMGVGKLAHSLGVDLDKAKQLKRTYFSALPNVKNLIERVQMTAKQRKYIFNWLGRKSYFPNPDFAYKAVNYLIQGGSADTVKVAMNKMAEFLSDKKTRMVLQIHDAVLFELHHSELDLIPTLKTIMEQAYPPRKCLSMEVSVEYSLTSWGDLKPYGPEARDEIERACAQGSIRDQGSLGVQDSANVDSRHP